MDNCENKLFEKFKEISKRIFLMQKEIITSLKISSSEYKILAVLSTYKDLTQTTLGEACGIDKPATSRLLFKLHLQGLITKAYKNGNKKNVYINLTEKGEEKAKEIRNKMYEIKFNHFNKLSESDTSLFINLVDKILLNKEVRNA